HNMDASQSLGASWPRWIRWGSDDKVADVKLAHISITACDAKRLAQFYIDALGLIERRPPKRLSGAIISRGNGLPGSDICSIWLGFPERSKPFLEIMEYSDAAQGGVRPINAPGYGHIALQVPDIEAALVRILDCGGSQQGEVLNLGSAERPCLCVYVRDPEENVLELESQPQG
ncbi:MAG: VOC family protein, partial [Pseudomonadota bacterium]